MVTYFMLSEEENKDTYLAVFKCTKRLVMGQDGAAYTCIVCRIYGRWRSQILCRQIIKSHSSLLCRKCNNIIIYHCIISLLTVNIRQKQQWVSARFIWNVVLILRNTGTYMRQRHILWNYSDISHINCTYSRNCLEWSWLQPLIWTLGQMHSYTNAV